MKKAILIISMVVLLISVLVGGFVFHIMNTPEYVLKNIVEDVNASGMDGLSPYLTGEAKKTLDTFSFVGESDLFNTIKGFINKNDYICILKSEIQEIEWGIDDILKSRKNAVVILSFNYEERLIGTIEISMIRKRGEWKINGIKFPKFTEVNW